MQSVRVSFLPPLSQQHITRLLVLGVEPLSSTPDHSVISVHLRGPLLREEGLEDEHLTEAHHEDGQGHEGGPDHHSLIQVLGPLSALREGGKGAKHQHRV